MKITEMMEGMLVAFNAPARNTDGMLVVGKITKVLLTVVDGHGYERNVDIDNVEPAEAEQQVAYWQDRAIMAERIVYGVMPGKEGREPFKVYGASQMGS